MSSELADLRKRVDELEAENRLLKLKLAALLQRLFGQKSEKLDPAQLLMEFSDILDVAPDIEDDEPPPPRPRGKRRRTTEILPENLPEVRTVIVPPEVEDDPEAYDQIGEETTAEVDVIPMQVVRRITVRPQFRLKDRSAPPIVAPAEPKLIPGSIASVSLLTYIVISKFIDHLPLYRLEAIFRRFGLDILRQRMCSWLWQIGDWLRVIYDQMKNDAFAGGYLQVDETPAKYLSPGHGKTKTGYLWVYHAPGEAVLFDWRLGRGAQSLHAMLSDFSGHIQCDGYAVYPAYNEARPLDDRLTLHGCWAHVRRKFFAAKEDSELARTTLGQIQSLYRIERSLRDENASALRRKVVRQEKSRPVVEAIGAALEKHEATHLPQGLTGAAVRYTRNLWPTLLGFLDDGRIEIDNNLAENTIRPIAIGRKNYLFFGSSEAGKQAAIIYSVVQTCRILDINVQDYLLDVLKRLPSLTAEEARELTPAKWAAARGLAAAA